jgi:anti-sigma factor RsiW
VTCQELAEFLMKYLEGELPEAQRASLDEHLDLCPPCLAYLETYRKTIELGRSICTDPSGAVPDDVPEELVQAVLVARQRES